MDNPAAPSSTSSEVFDLVGIGFGPAALAIAVALVENNEAAAALGGAARRPPNGQGGSVFSSLGGLQEGLGGGQEGGTGYQSEVKPRRVKVCFVEKHERFKWHPGMMLPGSRMQISFLKDLVTLRSPTSAYTFLSFLHSFTPSRLLSFISLANFAPTRVEFSQYLSWCATKVAASLESTGCGSIAYGEECLSIAAVLPSEDGEGDIELLRVTSRQADGSIIHRLARNILLSTGGAPFVPPLLRSEELKSKVVHSSEFLGRGKELLAQIGSVQGRTKKVAVYGAGQSACEIFMALASADSLVSSGGAERTQVDLLIHRGALRPADDSPFSNEVFDPGMSQAIYRLEDEGRAQVMKEARGTNYSVANATTLDAIYEHMYAEQVSPSPTAPLLVIQPYTYITSASPAPNDTSNVLLQLHNSITSSTRTEEYDAIFCGTGYERQGWKGLLFPSPRDLDAEEGYLPLRQLFARSSHVTTTSNSTSEDDLSVSSRSTSRSSPSTAPTSPHSSSCDLINSSPLKMSTSEYKVAENYRLDLPTKVMAGCERAFRPSVWLQGCNEATHGISDSLLSVLAVRSGEVVRGILDEGWFGEEAGQRGGLGSTKAWTLGGFVNEGAGLNTLQE